jgi:NAD-dependent DNA ligase
LIFVITEFKEDAAASLTHLIEQHGGRVTGNVSSRTSYLVEGTTGKQITHKLTDARESGVLILEGEDGVARLIVVVHLMCMLHCESPYAL